MFDPEYVTMKTVRLFDKKLAHQFSDNGWGSVWHRIAVLSKDGAVITCGDHTRYDYPAVLEIDGYTFIVFTACWEGMIKPEVIHCLTELRDTEEPTREVLKERVEKIAKHTPKMEITEELVRLRDRIEAFRKGHSINA